MLKIGLVGIQRISDRRGKIVYLSNLHFPRLSETITTNNDYTLVLIATVTTPVSVVIVSLSLEE